MQADIVLIERMLAPASPLAVKAMYERLRALPMSKAQSEMDDDRADMAILDMIQALDELPADLVETARARAMKTCTYVPMPADIMKLVEPEISERRTALAILKSLLGKAQDQ